MEEQARKLREAEIKRKEDIDRLKREEVQRKQAEEQRKKEEQRRAEERAIQERIEKQVNRTKIEDKPVKEKTDINMVVKMAAQNVANNIMNIEKRNIGG